MKFLYNCLIQVFEWSLPILGIFFSRLRTFYQERRVSKVELKKYLESNQKKSFIWVHVSSLGEYEQVVPVIAKLKIHYTEHSFIISFFSDSGYRVKKNKSVGDFETYLPLDTSGNAKEFIDNIKPKFVIFVKYDIWPNYLNYLKEREIPSFLVASRFRRNQIYFKLYGGFFKRALLSFNHIFVQDEASGQLLNKIKFKNWTVSGDTRYDRVSLQLKQDNRLDFMEAFVEDKLCMVCGSTWQEGENKLIPTINSKEINIKFVIAPHQIDQQHIAEIEQKLKKPLIKYSEIKNQNLQDYDILILDTVGILTKVYAYANMAYVGGGYGNSGLHNILEPAAFSIPILIGPNHHKFPEAKLLENSGGLKVVHSENEMFEIISKIFRHRDLRDKMSKSSKAFILNQIGATDITIKGILDNLN